MDTATCDDWRPRERLRSLAASKTELCAGTRRSMGQTRSANIRLRVVSGLGLHILREGEYNRSRFRWIRRDAHGMRKARGELLRPRNSIAVAAHRAETIVDACVGVEGVLEPLKDWTSLATGVVVTWKEQNRQSVQVSRSRTRDHICGTRAD